MDIAYKVVGYEDVDVEWRNREAFARMVLEGLNARPKQLNSAYFYDTEAVNYLRPSPGLRSTI